MILLKMLILIFITCAVFVVEAQQQNITQRRFPNGFLFGVATSSYQIEGAWNVDGKGESIWDRLVHTNPNHISDRSNGNIAANSYYLYRRDVEMLAELGVSHYRFSISWPRILPTGFTNVINQAGINYYNNLINELLSKNIQPFVTMYQWDLPQSIQDLGGWLNDDIQMWFGEYARVLYQNFGNRVKYWMTINEPKIHCLFGYGLALHAPTIRMPGLGDYLCGRNVLLANARAWHIYNNEFRAIQRGEVGIALDSDWPMASTNAATDTAAVTEYLAFLFGQFMDPIFSAQGNYPQIMIQRVANVSYQQGYVESRLRPFTPQQVAYMRGTADFLALNHYTSNYVYRNSSLASAHVVPSIQNDAYYGTYQDTNWPASATSWNREYAPGLHRLLVYIKNTYNNPKIYISENGMSTGTGLNDDTRVQYYRNYLTAVLDALDDGVNVQGYTAWSLMDNFEWSDGYSPRFGLYEVNMTHSNRTRRARKSALIYADVIKSRFINFTYNPVIEDDAFTVNASKIIIFILFIVNIII